MRGAAHTPHPRTAWLPFAARVGQGGRGTKREAYGERAATVHQCVSVALLCTVLFAGLRVAPGWVGVRVREALPPNLFQAPV